MTKSRETLIANVSWWAGWCTDNENVLPELTKLSALLLDVKDQMRKDRPNPEFNPRSTSGGRDHG